MELILKYFPGLSNRQTGQLAALDGLYHEWNAKINVISRKDMDGLYEKHVLHSLSIAKIFDFKPGTSIIDIGTGGGFPGIPLAILFPGVHFHLVDSIRKKINVVNAVKESLQLQNVTVGHTRAEQVKHIPFDHAVSRAVAPLKELIAWSKPLLKRDRNNKEKPGLICLKGGDLTQEIYESGTRPQVYDISHYFTEPFFNRKYILVINA